MSTEPTDAAETGPVRRMPAEGRDRTSILTELEQLAAAEDAVWEDGQCSGTMYCGDHGHYEFMNQAFGLFAHVNALQRDMCPSMTKFEGEDRKSTRLNSSHRT